VIQVLKPARKPRKKMVSFAGGFLFWQDPGGLRSEMRTMFQVHTNPAILWSRSLVGNLPVLAQPSASLSTS
jgi:hypothetical protein